MDCLEEATDPPASAVSMTETDEAAQLWQVIAYYEARPDDARLTQLTQGVAYSVAQLDDTDWVAKSIEDLHPVIAGRFCVHGSHHERPRSGGINLLIDAGLAFGTGHHGTTRGCLLALDAITKQRRVKNVLDVGCGTGVLGIAAARAAHCRVIASDIDPQAEIVTAENSRLNGTSTLVTTRTAIGTRDRCIAENSPYDLIFANILARPLIGLAQPIIELTTSGTDIVLSGLLIEQEALVLAAYRNRGALLHRRLHLENWSTLWLKS